MYDLNGLLSERRSTMRVNTALVLASSLGLLSSCNTVSNQSSLSASSVGSFELHNASGTIDDLHFAPVANAIGTSRFVALGEDMHLSAGVLSLNFELTRYMIEHRGFREVAFEADFFTTSVANDFIFGRHDDLKGALRANTLYRSTAKEITDFYLWCRSWNEAYPQDPVYFSGFDFQHAYAAGNVLRGFLQGVLSSTEFGKIWAPFAEVRGASEQNFENYLNVQSTTTYSKNDYIRHQSRITALGSFMASKKSSWLGQGISSASYQTAAWALQSLEFETRKNLLFTDGKASEAFAHRDDAMAFIFLKRISSSSQRKTVLAAHNLHLGRFSNGLVLKSGQGSGNQMPVNFGARIAKALQSDYRVFLTMGFNIVGSRFPAATPYNGTVQNLLRGQTVGPGFFTPQHSLFSSGNQAVFFMPDSTPVQTYKAVPSQICDGIIWLDSSIAAGKLTDSELQQLMN